MNVEGDLTEGVEVTDSALEPPPRGVGELVQLLGVAAPSEIMIGELEARESAPMLDVHEETRHQLQWKPRYFAESTRGTLRIKVTRLEAQELMAAGAATKH